MKNDFADGTRLNEAPRGREWGDFGLGQYMLCVYDYMARGPAADRRHCLDLNIFPMLLRLIGNRRR